MKKLLITTGIFPPDIGGPASYGRVVAQNLAHDVSVNVLTYGSHWSEPSDTACPYRVIRVWRKIPKPFRQISYLLHTLSQVQRADAVFSLGTLASGFPSALAAKLWHKPIFVRVSGDRVWESSVGAGRTGLMINDFQKTKRRGWDRVLQWAQVWVCKRATHIAVQSEYLAGIVVGWGIPRSKISVIYNGSDFVPSTLSPEEARKKIGISGSIMLSVGRLVPWKGFRMLIKLMPQLLDLNPFLRLVIVGDGPDRVMLASMIRNLSLQSKIYLVGKKNPSDLAVYFAASEMFVLNTGYEGFSHQILEAMASGVPVITTTAGGNREIIKQGENGFMVKYNDEFNLFEAMKTLMDDGELKTHFVEEGRKTLSRFTVADMIERTKKMLNL